jgi:hypothetical protein
MPSRRRLFLLALSSAAAIGCGGDVEPAGTACEAESVEGHVVFHSLNRLASGRSGRPIDPTGLVASVVHLDALASGASPEPLAETELVGEGCAQASNGSCGFSLDFCRDDVVGGGDLGITIGDEDSGDASLWLTTAQPLDAKAPFAVTRDALETVIAPLLGEGGDDVLRRGVIFGLVYSSSAGASGQGTALAGATVTASDEAVSVVYPTTTFDGFGTATGRQGIFLAIAGADGAASTTTFRVTPPAGIDLSWDEARIGRFVPGAMFFQVMFAE